MYTVTKREAGAELRALAKEGKDILSGEEPRDSKRLAEIAERARVLMKVVGFEEPL